MAGDIWAAGDAYEAYVGRWSRQVAVAFLDRLPGPATGGRWLDAGCGTGALTAAALARGAPTEIVGADPSEGFLAHARSTVDDTRAGFVPADARALPFPDNHFDVVVSGLALNFVPEPAAAVAEFARVLKPGGTAAAYVWDYAVGMEMMRYFWDAAATIDPAAARLDEGRRFPLCRPEPLRTLWTEAGFTGVAVEPIDIPTGFRDFDDYWQPFLGGTGAAPGYLAGLSDPDRDAVRDLLRSRLPADDDGSIPLTARAWSVNGTLALVPDA